MDFSQLAEYINFIDPKDFEEISDIVIADCLNVNSEGFSIKSVSKKLRIKSAVAKDVINAFVCIIMHLAKTRCRTKELDAMWPQMWLKNELKSTFTNIILPVLPELREVLDTAEDEHYNKFKDIEWRLSVTVSTRMKQNMCAPKYTMKLTMKDQEGSTNKYLIDSDYSNMVRLRDELSEALKSLDSPFSKKVFKFMK